MIEKKTTKEPFCKLCNKVYTMDYYNRIMNHFDNGFETNLECGHIADHLVIREIVTYTQSEVDEIKSKFKPMHETLLSLALEQLRRELKDRIIRKINLEFKDFICGVQYPEEGYNLILKEFENVIDSVFSSHEPTDKVELSATSDDISSQLRETDNNTHNGRDTEKVVFKRQTNRLDSLSEANSEGVIPSTPDVSFSDEWEQVSVEHCPIKDCGGMLLSSRYRHEMMCSDCKKFFMYSGEWKEIHSVRIGFDKEVKFVSEPDKWCDSCACYHKEV